MKLQELKHNHSLTDLLKIILFSILMLLPFLSVATRCLYVICNKNAFESYYGQTINEEQYISVNENTITLNDSYIFNSFTINYVANTTYNRSNTYLYVKLLESNSSAPSLNDGTNYYFGVYKVDSWDFNTWGISLTQGGEILQSIQTNTSSVTSFKVEVLNYYFVTNDILDTTNILQKIEYNKNSYLDNVFEYSMSQMSENPMFNWTQNTALYTGVRAMTDNLEIQTPIIAVLIVYWFILTIIYIIIDITLKLFTYLTHGIFHKS